MATEINLHYNPFLPQLTILIDGKQPPEYSRLIQFSDEDIWKWHSEILNVLYSEIKDDFYLTFIGRDLDAKILQFECEKNKHCIGFSSKPHLVNVSLQKRLGSLNQLIKSNGGINYQHSILEAHFIIPNELQSYLDEILSIDINNLFCSTRIHASNTGANYIDNTENSFIFILTKDVTEGEKISEKCNSKNPIFLICCGDDGKDNKPKKITSSCIVYECDFNDIISAIFDCFLGFPLTQVLRNCLQSISLSANRNDILKISAVEPLVDIKIEQNIEVGKSAIIRTTFDPPLVSPPKVLFRTVDTLIATTDNMSVFGIKPGKTQLEAYYYGAQKPFQTCELNVIQRNRIKKIILNDDELLLGIGDTKKMHFTYSPSNADNANMITWKSSDEKIATIDKHGTLICKSSGVCKILCIAENISAICHCEILPYLESLSVDLPSSESNNELLLKPMQEYELLVKPYPQNSIDSSYCIISSDYNVANIVGNTIIAKNIGTATIEIINASRRKKISFVVNVSKPKRNFFKNLFKT